MNKRHALITATVFATAFAAAIPAVAQTAEETTQTTTTTTTVEKGPHKYIYYGEIRLEPCKPLLQVLRPVIRIWRIPCGIMNDDFAFRVIL